jgi:hypothetical protein
MIRLLAIAICVVLSHISSEKLMMLRTSIRDEDQTFELRYLPSGANLKALSLGYTNVLGNVLWFNAINYFGKHYHGDRNLKWLYHMCDMVAELDPRAHHVYEFCGAMLAWENNTPEQAVQILTTGVRNIPESWYLLYLRGFTQLYFLNNKQGAKDDFIAATKIEGSPIFVARLAASTLNDLEDPMIAVGFLEEMISRASDESAKRSLVEKRDAILRNLRTQKQ